jgi:hypothetical protein
LFAELSSAARRADPLARNDKKISEVTTSGCRAQALRGRCRAFMLVAVSCSGQGTLSFREIIFSRRAAATAANSKISVFRFARDFRSTEC